MADDKKLNKNNRQGEEDGSGRSDAGSQTGSASGTGGQAGGQVEFRDFVGLDIGHLRDKDLPVDEKRRLIAVHKANHEAKVKKQKDLLANRKAVKEGKMTLSDYRTGRGYGAGMNSLTKTHPLSNTAQFGNGSIDNKINAVPSENTSETNNEHKQELEYQYKLENKLVQTYANSNRYRPKPSPF